MTILKYVLKQTFESISVFNWSKIATKNPINLYWHKVDDNFESLGYDIIENRTRLLISQSVTFIRWIVL